MFTGNKFSPILLAVASCLIALGLRTSTLIAADSPPQETVTADKEARVAAERARDEKAKAIAHWEDIILFYGDEESGEWSLRIEDKSVKDRAWFEFLELWQFIPNEGRWRQIPTEKFSKPIVLPKTKGNDEPENSQMLYKLEEIPPKTAGLWFGKWRVDNTIEGGTMMRIGTAHSKSKPPADPVPSGTIRMTVPVTVENAIWAFVPDPRLYCVKGGPGKPEGKGKSEDTKSEPKTGE